MKEEETVQTIYIKEEEIKKIVEKIKYLNFDKFKKKEHYKFSLLEKNINEKEIKDYFTKFDKIKMIFFRKRASGYNNYDLFYEKEDGTYITYSINLDKIPPELINAFLVDRIFKNFMSYIKKHYQTKII